MRPARAPGRAGGRPARCVDWIDPARARSLPSPANLRAHAPHPPFCFSTASPIAIPTISPTSPLKCSLPTKLTRPQPRASVPFPRKIAYGRP
eukprot:3739623-Prymnesium_polylepis.1